LRNTFTKLAALLLFAVASEFACAEEPVLLLMPEPLAGMSVTKTPLMAKDEVVGYHVEVAGEVSVSKVVVQIETKADLSARKQRVDGLKGYVNGLANGLKGAGFELQASEVPNLKTTDFARQLRVEPDLVDAPEVAHPVVAHEHHLLQLRVALEPPGVAARELRDQALDGSRDGPLRLRRSHGHGQQRH